MPRRPRTTAEKQPPPSPLDRIGFALAAVLLLVVPLVSDTGALETFRGPQRELAHACWAALAALLAVRATAATWRDRWWLPWFGALGAGLAAAALSRLPGLSLGSLLPLALAALGWGAIRQLDERRRSRLRGLLVAAGILQATLTLLLAAAGAGAGQQWDRWTWIGTLGSPGYVAVFLVLPCVVAATLALEQRRHRWFLAAAVMALVIVLTQTFTALAALLAAAVPLAWRRLPVRRRLAAAAAAAALLTLLLVSPPLGPRLREKAAELRTQGFAFAGQRAFGLAAGASMVAARPLVGHGPGGFAREFYTHRGDAMLAEATLRTQLGYERGRLVLGFAEAHNEPLQFTAENGLLGLLLVAAGLGLALRTRPIPSGVLTERRSLLVAAAVVALLWFPLHIAAVAAQWAVAAALMLPPLPAAASRRHGLRLAVVALVALLAGGLAWQRHSASRAFAAAEDGVEALRRSAPTRTRAGFARAALASLEGRERWLPGRLEPPIVLGTLALEAGEAGRAAAAFGRALLLAERPETRFDVGIALAQAGERGTAIAHLARAVELNPLFFPEIRDPDVRTAVRLHLDANGFSARYPWVWSIEGIVPAAGASR